MEIFNLSTTASKLYFNTVLGLDITAEKVPGLVVWFVGLCLSHRMLPL